MSAQAGPGQANGGNPGALDTIIRVTLFDDQFAKNKVEHVASLREMAGQIRDTRAATKARLPWIKLATFGDDATFRGSLRNDVNLRDIYGIEADYDGEQITLDRARQIIGQANVAALLYTSPSNTAAKPRWRVLCPTSEPLPPEARAPMVARINGLFVGALAGESFTLSQAYYFGALHGSTDHQVICIEGRHIDACDELDATAIGRPSKAPAVAQPSFPQQPSRLGIFGIPDGEMPAFEAPTEGSRYGLAALTRECSNIRYAPDGGKHHALNKAAFSIGGLVAAGELPEGPAFAAMADALASIRHRCGDYAHAERTLRAAFEDGKRAPRQPPPPRDDTTYSSTMGGGEPKPEDPRPTGEAWDEAAPKAARPNPLWIDADAWDASTIPPRPWVVPGYLMRGSVSVLSGQGAGGKSSLVVGWTVALATGEAIGEFAPPAPCIAVNYNVEDDQQEQLRRYSAGLMAVRKAPTDIAGRVIRCGPRTIGTLFQRDPASGRVMATEAMDALETLCMETQADVLICDPLAELHNAEENDNTAMRAIIAAFRGLAARLGIAVMILHHDRKGNNAPGDMDRMRGASAITGAVRVMLTLTTMSQEEADKFGIPPEDRRRHFRIDGAKSNYAIATDAEWWRLAPYEIGNREAVAACLPWDPPSTFDGVSMAACVAVLDAIRKGKWGCDVKAADEWAGRLLTANDPGPGRTDTQAKAILRAWESTKLLTRGEPEPTATRNKRRNYKVNDDQFQQMRRDAGQ